MLDINGWTIEVDDMSLYWLIMDVAEGRLTEVQKIADQLRSVSKPTEYPSNDLL